MKGVIYNLVESVVRSERGDDAWDDVIDEAGVSGAYTSLGSYPDSDLVDIATTVARQVGTDPSSSRSYRVPPTRTLPSPCIASHQT